MADAELVTIQVTPEQGSEMDLSKRLSDAGYVRPTIEIPQHLHDDIRYFLEEHVELTDEAEYDVLTTKIVDEKYHGVKILYIDSIYGFRSISQSIIDDIYEGIEKFAKANNCGVIMAEYSIKRVGEFLGSKGFEAHKTISRKVL